MLQAQLSIQAEKAAPFSPVFSEESCLWMEADKQVLLKKYKWAITLNEKNEGTLLKVYGNITRQIFFQDGI